MRKWITLLLAAGSYIIRFQRAGNIKKQKKEDDMHEKTEKNNCFTAMPVPAYGYGGNGRVRVYG